MDLFDLVEHGGSVDASMAKIQVKKVLIIGVTTDILFPPRQQQELVDSLRVANANVEHVEIDSPNGHDAFLIDEEHFSPVVRKFLAEAL